MLPWLLEQLCLNPPVDRTARKSLIGFLLFWARGLKIHGNLSLAGQDKVLLNQPILFSELYHLLTYADYAA